MKPIDKRVHHKLLGPPANGARYKGVVKQGNSWTARGQKGGYPVHLGCFRTEEDAARARDKWAVETYGLGIWLNIPETEK